VGLFKTQIFIYSFKLCFPVYPGLSAVGRLLMPNCYLHQHGHTRLSFLDLSSLSGHGHCWQYLVNVSSVQFYISCIIYSNSLCDIISLAFKFFFFFLLLPLLYGWNTAVGIATYCGLDSPGFAPWWWARFSLPCRTGPGAHSASSTMATRSLQWG